MASEVAGKVPAVIARLAVASTVCVLASVAAAAPNIVLILTDDQGWSQSSVAMDDSVEEAHSSYLETPNITRLANAGMRFASGYAPAPLCTPTRRSILGGTSAARSGPEFRSTWVPKDHMTIPTALEGADPDYRSAHFGKWGAQMNSTGNITVFVNGNEISISNFLNARTRGGENIVGVSVFKARRPRNLRCPLIIIAEINNGAV